MPILGGVVAAALGFGLAQVVPGGWPLADNSARIAALESRLTEQDRRIADLSDAAPLAALGERLDTVTAEVGALASLPARIEALQTELAALTQAEPAAPVDLAPIRAEIDALRAEIATLPGDGIATELAALKAAAEAERTAAEARTEALRAEAEATARSALARGAALRVQAALDSGAALGPALADLIAAGIAVPPALASHAEGVATLVALQNDFPDAARAALAASHAPEAEADWSNRLTAFFKAQTGMRSLTPREGDDPDAVLSRAEAALHDGDLTRALAELDALPGDAAAALADWRARAETRAEAAAALAGLATDLTPE